MHSSVTHLVNSALIECAEPVPGMDQALIGPSAFVVTRRERALLSLRSGRMLDGLIEMAMPLGYNRTSDFVKGGNDFSRSVVGLARCS